MKKYEFKYSYTQSTSIYYGCIDIDADNMKEARDKAEIYMSVQNKGEPKSDMIRFFSLTPKTTTP